MKKRIQLALLLIMSTQAMAGDWTMQGDWLLWHSSEDTSAFAANRVTFLSTPFRFEPVDMSFDWDQGFRLGVEYDTLCSKWQQNLMWTHFTANTGANFSPEIQDISSNFFSGFLAQDFYFGADIDTNLVLNQIDYFVSYSHPLTNILTVSPSIGLTGARIKQTFKSRWEPVIYSANEKVSSEFYGVGPRFGLDLEWKLSSCLTLLSRGSLALMWGTWNINDTYQRKDTFFEFVDPTIIETDVHHSMLGTSVLDYFLGLSWSYCGRSNFTLQAGYEFEFWPNQLKIPTFQQLPVHGDLTLQGVTCRIKIDL